MDTLRSLGKLVIRTKVGTSKSGSEVTGFSLRVLGGLVCPSMSKALLGVSVAAPGKGDFAVGSATSGDRLGSIWLVECGGLGNPDGVDDAVTCGLTEEVGAPVPAN
jgi:hypothetical protein